MFDYIIVGAGFSGSVFAERIANILDKKVLIIDKKNHLGGHCYDFKNKYEITIHKYGPHIFHTNLENVYNYITKFTDILPYKHRVLGIIDGKKIPIPFNLNSISTIFSNKKAKIISSKLISNYGFDTNIPILDLLKCNDDDLRKLAEYIYDKVFKNYTMKQWGISPEQIDPSVTARVPISISYDNRYFHDKFQFIPAKGYSRIFSNMLSNQNIKIELNTDFKSLIRMDEKSKKIYFKNKLFDGKLIFTGSIDELFNYKYGLLPYRSLDIKFENIHKEEFQTAAVENYPNDFDFTRITEFKKFMDEKSDYTTICREYPLQYNPENKKLNPYYPIRNNRNIELLNKYLKDVNLFQNIILAGRLAEYKYFNMDNVINNSLNIFEKLVKND
jgi:UDP-galactopyranose mutase